MKSILEVADVFRDGEKPFRARYGKTLSIAQHRVFNAIVRCRTAALGGHIRQCDDCGHQQIQYNSCRNRHCPKCQAMARANWLDKREGELLPIPYFHIVFTLPHELAHLALQNQKVVYGILFQAASQTLLKIGADPKHLGAKIGFLMVLHTWGSNLMHHPHVHAIVSGGGLSPDGKRWIHGRHRKRGKEYFAPGKVLSLVFRGMFIKLLKEAYAAGRLEFHGKLQTHEHPHEFEKLLNKATRHKWVVYAKRPFSSPVRVLKYLARYTHRVAISNQRLVSMKDGQVTFRYKNYTTSENNKIMTLESSEFIRRRFLMHTLPKRFVRIRYYGFLANRERNRNLQRCRELLGVALEQNEPPPDVADQPEESVKACPTCPTCQRGKLVIIEVIDPPQPIARPHMLMPRVDFAKWFDSS
jgi:hypothetical protein